MPTRKFAPLPYGMIQDPQLPAELRVMGFLCTHDPYRTGDPFPANRDSIASATGLHETSVSKVTARLVAGGWLIKHPAKRGQSAQYAINWGGGSNTPKAPNGVPDRPPQNGTNGVAGRTPHEGGDGVADRASHEGNGVPDRPPAHLLYKDRSIDTSNRQSVSTREEDGKEPTDFSFSDAVKVLQEHGVPERYFFNPTDRQLILAWPADGFSLSDLDAACDIGRQQRKQQGDPQPIGPRYVDRILRSMNRHAAGSAVGPESLEDKDYASGSWS